MAGRAVQRRDTATETAHEATRPANPALDSLRPLSRVSLARDAREFRPVEVQADDGTGAMVARVQNVSPLDWLAKRARDPLQPFQLEAGRLVERDFARARSGGIRGSSTSWAAAALYATHEAMQANESGRGFARRAGASYSVADHRLDAIRKLGQLHDAVGAVSFHLLSRFIGDEIGIGDLARECGEDEKFIGRRLREALDDAAAFYSLALRGYAPHPGRR